MTVLDNRASTFKPASGSKTVNQMTLTQRSTRGCGNETLVAMRIL